MPHASATLAVAATCAALVAPSHGQQPPAAPAVPPVSPAPPQSQARSMVRCAAPAAADPALALPFTTETTVLTSPVPTIAPTWGYRSAVAGGVVVVAGAERAVAPGPLGQVAVWRRQGADWSVDPDLAQVDRVPTAAYALSDLQRAGPFVLTAVDRRDKGTSIRVLDPSSGRAAEVASLLLPADADLVSFGSAFAGDADVVAVGSADMRFNLKEESANRSRDPRVFLWSRTGTAWGLDGFVRAPASAPGIATDAMWFGASLAVSDGTLAVGSPGTLMPRPSEVLPRSGVPMVHVFRRDGGRWIPEAAIAGTTFTPALCFGIKVALGGDLLAVRSVDPERAQEPASVWLFRRSGGAWKPAQELVPGKGITRGRGYGLGLAVSGGRVIVGDGTARGADEAGEAGPGMAFVFEERDGRWENTVRLMPRAECGSRSFGNDLSAEWPLVSVGRPKNELLGLEPGGVYLFDLSSSPSAPR
jgi:hypothetical protein